MVLLTKTEPVWLKGGLGRLAGSVSWGIDVHVSTQWSQAGALASIDASRGTALIGEKREEARKAAKATNCLLNMMCVRAYTVCVTPQYSRGSHTVYKRKHSMHNPTPS